VEGQERVFAREQLVHTLPRQTVHNRNNIGNVGGCFLYADCAEIISREWKKIYACLAWEFAADSYLLKLQRLQNKVLRTIGYFPRCTPVRDLYRAFNLPYVYDYIIKLRRQQEEVIQNYENEHDRSIGLGRTRHRGYKGLKLGDSQAYDRSIF
jgi:hypothetical protein